MPGAPALSLNGIPLILPSGKPAICSSNPCCGFRSCLATDEYYLTTKVLGGDPGMECNVLDRSNVLMDSLLIWGDCFRQAKGASDSSGCTWPGRFTENNWVVWAYDDTIKVYLGDPYYPDLPPIAYETTYPNPLVYGIDYVVDLLPGCWMCECCDLQNQCIVRLEDGRN